MMYIRCNLKKGSADASDFENNYKAEAMQIDKILLDGTVILKSIDYTDFKSHIDGNSVTWKNVLYIDGKKNYELWLIVA